MSDKHNEIIDIHSWLMDKKFFCNIVSDTGGNEDGWVVVTLSCEKSKLPKKLEYLKRDYDNGFEIKLTPKKQ